MSKDSFLKGANEYLSKRNALADMGVAAVGLVVLGAVAHLNGFPVLQAVASVPFVAPAAIFISMSIGAVFGAKEVFKQSKKTIPGYAAAALITISSVSGIVYQSSCCLNKIESVRKSFVKHSPRKECTSDVKDPSGMVFGCEIVGNKLEIKAEKNGK